MSGTLFVVGTPIGNLEDMTFRALRTLKEVDVIAAEDTRRTAKLLAHYEIRTPMLSLHEHNEYREAPRVVERLRRGESVALVTDAGTPGIADPGARLVAAAHAAQIRVVPIPGASSVATAVSVSGFDASEFVFMGFPPRSGTARSLWFDRLGSEARTVVFFEAPHRVSRTLEELKQTAVKRPIIVFRELTKFHESLVILDNISSTDKISETGEIAIILGPIEGVEHALPSDSTIADYFGRLTSLAGFSDDDAIFIIKVFFDAQPSAVKKALKRHKIWVKQQTMSTP